MRKIVIMGPPGSGKGTQAKIISEKYGLPHISIGDILRENIMKRTELGALVKQYIDRGELVPDNIIIELTLNTLRNMLREFGGYILDGYPRTIAQAEALEQTEMKPEIVIDIRLSEEECVKRLTSRRYCPKCGEIYNMILKPPRIDEICDKCGSKLLVRDDDKEDVVRRRFKEYYVKTKPVMEYYEKLGKLRVIDGSGSVDEVSRRIIGELGL
ncbi:MAG: adenylate kinase [Candidatus Verstraetearchaeota archaeon]|jgi:adenylate kinase|nr:adenylate kinase [Candidatus Verstraetearchaeota archaeon]